MKTLIIYLFMFFGIIANAQDYSLIEKSNELNKELLEVEKAKNYDIYREITQLKVQVATLIKEVNVLKEKQSTDIKSILDDLNIKTVKEEDLPKDLEDDELGIAFIEDDNGITYIGVSFENNWKIIKL